jgi:hypothetical protein
VHDRRVIGRALAAVVVVLVTCAVLLLGPIHATGVRGTALRPHYVSFYVGFYSFAPLAGSADTKAVLAQAGITAPSVAVRRRREAAAGAATVAAVIGGVLVARTRRVSGAGRQAGNLLKRPM